MSQEFPNVHWLWKGGISFVYEVHPRIVVKVPKSGDFQREQFRKELLIQDILSRSPPCSALVQCFYFTVNGMFLEYMRDVSLCSRIQDNHIRDERTMIVTEVIRLEPLPLRKKWMNDLAHAVAFLESLQLAHGDLRPENILLDRDRLKLSDFDCTAEIGTPFEACMAPYGRILNGSESNQGRRGTPGFLGPRTEQFALGSLYYLINYGFEVYGNRCLTEDPQDHGCKVVDLLQSMQFPDLNGDKLIDETIRNCWNHGYSTVAELAAYTETLLYDRINQNEGDECVFMPRSSGKAMDTEIADSGDSKCHSVMDNDYSLEDFSEKKAYCQDLETRGLLNMLSSGEPEELGFTLQWYRHSDHKA